MSASLRRSLRWAWGLAVILLWACGAPPRILWPDAHQGPVVLPLVVAHGQQPPVVTLGFGADAQGRPRQALCVVSTAEPDLRLSVSLAEALALPVRGFLTSAPRAVVPTLVFPNVAPDAPEARLEAVPARVLPDAEFPQVAQTPVSCALGWRVWAEGALEHDPQRGVLRLWPTAPGEPLAESERWPLVPRGAGFGLQVSLARAATAPWPLAVERAHSQIDPAFARELKLWTPSRFERVVERGWWGAVQLGQRVVSLFLRGEPPAGAQGLLGADFLRELRWRWLPGEPALWVSAQMPARGWLRRFADLEACGAQGQRCVRGQVERVEGQRLWVRFAATPQVLPAAYWAVVDVGTLLRPLLLWVRVGPNAVRAVASIQDARISPEGVRGAGRAVDVVDFVPLAPPCVADLCLWLP